MGQIQTELKDDVLRITIDRPEKKNALTSAMYDALADAVEQGEATPEVRVMLLHGNGDSFTAGNDLEDFVANPWKGHAVPPALRFIAAMAGAKKPVVAAVHGSAVGIGVTILLALRPGLRRGQRKAGNAIREPRDCARSWIDSAAARAHGTSARFGTAFAGLASGRAACLRIGPGECSGRSGHLYWRPR